MVRASKLPFQQCKFLVSAAKLSQCPEDIGAEVAFAGRSNAGKSSALNTLTEQKKLARTSKTPGRTQLINFFYLTPEQRLVDLPGYGYAKVAESVKNHWQRHLDDYLRHRASLRGLVLVMDIRHPLQDFDCMLLDWAAASKLPVHILLTKADKLKKGPAKNQLLNVKKALQGWQAEFSVQTYSALKKTGVEELRNLLENWLAIDEIP